MFACKHGQSAMDGYLRRRQVTMDQGIIIFTVHLAFSSSAFNSGRMFSAKKNQELGNLVMNVGWLQTKKLHFETFFYLF